MMTQSPSQRALRDATLQLQSHQLQLGTETE
jgi:hypothetical protein